MKPSRTLVALVLSIATGLTAQAQAPSSADARTPGLPAPDARDPWGILHLSDTLLVDENRIDEGIAVLMAAAREPVTRVEALSRLDRQT